MVYKASNATLTISLKNIEGLAKTIMAAWILFHSSHASPMNVSPRNFYLDNTFYSTLGPLPAGRSVKIFKNQSFYYPESNITFFAGAIAGSAPPIRLECFVYVNNHGDGKIFFMSSKADKLWSCVGVPTLSLKAESLQNIRALMLSLFTYQAPSGEFFRVPLIVQLEKGGDLKVGHVDRCVEEKTKNKAVTKISQLYRFANQCLS
jgi:hypothetical protein